MPDPQVQAHLEWLGFVQPTQAGGPPPGLVVSATALVSRGAILPRSDADGQAALREAAGADFEGFARTVLGWSFAPRGYVERDGGWAVRMAPGEDALQLLVTELEPGADFDAGEVSAHSRMERGLRAADVPAGLLCNGAALRLISAPRGESSGWLEFRVADMEQTAGRPIVAALRLLLNERRLLTLPTEQRLAALLTASRRYQNDVSVALAEQVLHALYELLRGLQAADGATGGELLREPLHEDPDDVYRALLTVILRMLFVLYAEEREMLPADEAFLRYYSLAGLHERLREDAAHHPDTMDQRYGAWAQLLVLFRMVHDGARSAGLRMPPRHGALFDPDRYPFLEGRAGRRQRGARIEPPLVGDGTVLRALDKLLVLRGERLSYRALDVEQIGSVYETMMGFRLERATGRSLAIKAPKKGGAPTAVDLDALLTVAPEKRGKWLTDAAHRTIPAGVTTAVRAAEDVAGLHAALLKIADRVATPDLVPAGALVLQPSEERRRSGSHYTPRALTAPIVRDTLAPVLAALGERPRPEALLELKVCDPAIGSGAFLVEACRQLGDALVASWHAHGERPELPADEDEAIFARRLVAQRCLYGVDKNPVAVDLAKLSLWLVTLAREHAFTFLDHALRHGDSLVGLTRRQIEAFHWAPAGRAEGFETLRIRESVARASGLRAAIRTAGEGVSDAALHQLWDDAQAELRSVRLAGDLAVLAFFGGAKAGERETRRTLYAETIADGRIEEHRWEVEAAREAEPPLAPFHWEAEFPEVFDRARPGFDAIVGNPPFGGKNTVTSGNPARYLDWLKSLHKDSHGNADLVAHFYRRAFSLLRQDGGFGLIATNTIRQGDTRGTGLRWILGHGGAINHATRRVKWPGLAAVVVSVVHVVKGAAPRPRLDGRPVRRISAFLFHDGGDADPERLAANAEQGFKGVTPLGKGFEFDDTDATGVASPVAEGERLLAAQPANAEAIKPYLGGDEFNMSPTQVHQRYVIDFGERDEAECRRRWPELMAIVEERVKPGRMSQNDPSAKARWWQFDRPRPGLRAAIADLPRVLALSQTSSRHALGFLRADMVFSQKLVVFSLNRHAAFAALQSRPHELWSIFFGSSMKDDPVYTPSDCFETFPFPPHWTTDPDFEEAGRAYYEHRARLMVARDEGMTKTYNRFHDPEETGADILELRDLHTAMDRAVLHAYGWDDVDTTCEFLLDYEDEDDGSSRRRKPWRYRWPDAVRDDVLARLLALNAERAAAEQLTGGGAAARTERASRGKPALQPDA